VNIFITKILVQMQLKYYLQVKVQSSERVDFLSVRRYARVASMVYAMALYLLSICMETAKLLPISCTVCYTVLPFSHTFKIDRQCSTVLVKL